MPWPCETRTSTCRSFVTISGLCLFLGISVLLLMPKDILQVGPLHRGRIKIADLLRVGWRARPDDNRRAIADRRSDWSGPRPTPEAQNVSVHADPWSSGNVC